MPVAVAATAQLGVLWQREGHRAELEAHAACRSEIDRRRERGLLAVAFQSLRNHGDAGWWSRHVEPFEAGIERCSHAVFGSECVSRRLFVLAERARWRR